MTQLDLQQRIAQLEKEVEVLEVLSGQKDGRIAELENDEVRQRLANAENQLYMKDLAIQNVKTGRRAQWRKRKAAEEERDALQQQVNALAAESLAKSDRLQRLVEIINKADNRYCMCGESMETHDQIGGCGNPAGMFDYHYGRWMEACGETPATDAIKRQWMADGIYDYLNRSGYEVPHRLKVSLVYYAKKFRQPEEKGHE